MYIVWLRSYGVDVEKRCVAIIGWLGIFLIHSVLNFALPLAGTGPAEYTPNQTKRICSGAGADNHQSRPAVASEEKKKRAPGIFRLPSLRTSVAPSGETSQPEFSGITAQVTARDVALLFLAWPVQRTVGKVELLAMASTSPPCPALCAIQSRVSTPPQSCNAAACHVVFADHDSASGGPSPSRSWNRHRCC